jgi:hypothetical protein
LQAVIENAEMALMSGTIHWTEHGRFGLGWNSLETVKWTPNCAATRSQTFQARSTPGGEI